MSPANKAGTKRSGEQIGHNVPLCDKDGPLLSQWGLGGAVGVQGAVDTERRVRVGQAVIPKALDAVTPRSLSDTSGIALRLSSFRDHRIS